jgi:hypothetical protein
MAENKNTNAKPDAIGDEITDIYDAAQRAKQSESNATCQANCTLAIHNRYQWIRPYNKWPMQILVYDAQTDQNHRSQCVEDCSAEAKVADQLFKVANKQHHRSPATAATGQTTLGQATQNRSNSKHTAHRTPHTYALLTTNEKTGVLVTGFNELSCLANGTNPSRPAANSDRAPVRTCECGIARIVRQSMAAYRSVA